ncbi:hypothetical protein H6784_04165 [Candidatus Nomurabacteria bacterium]|nr:hypothetical protein [Candidatus Nomurabacteria bacterium]
MKLDAEQIKLLGLSTKEIKVLDALRAGNNTPLLINKAIKVSRPAIYEILVKLHKRGLVKTNIVNGKKYWSQAKEKDIEQNLYNTKKQLFNIDERVEEVHGLSDSTVMIHRGGEAIRQLLYGIIKDHKEQRLLAIQGDVVVIGWEKVFGTEQTNEINRFIKKNAIIVETIMPFGWFERQTELLGKKWAEEFEGRSAISHEIAGDYFQHAGQIWMFKNSVYLIAMNEEIIIEIRHSEIQKLIKSMFEFIKDNSRKFDVNARLRELLAKTYNS